MTWSSAPAPAPARAPLDDVTALLAETRTLGLEARSRVFIAHFLRFAGAAASWQHLVRQALSDGRRVAVFCDANGWVVRVARHAMAAEAVLRDERAYVLHLTDTCGGRLEGVALEDLSGRDRWQRLADRAARRPATSPRPTRPTRAA